MAKIFKNFKCLIALIMLISTPIMMNSCKENASTSAEKAKQDSNKYGSLGALLNKACGYDCDDDEECGSCDNNDGDDIELIGFDVVEDDEDGSEVPVAYFKCGNEIFQLMDIDGDGTFDVAVYDANDDEDISDDEIIDISNEEISVEELAQSAIEGGCCDAEDGCDSYNDENEDDECDGSCNASSSSSGRRLQRQAQEDANEQDLPDYVNNAHVKALRKK